ncbi:hypothetical protein MGYG_03729 [Nannizzia gypsea CBS 118893]|uniref:Uncharacterized protein n=1 Tax=Arthroderma gypseum (strain ATCC MYA-4604 / CBS 118893) TaxID=535722 RepID=E4UTL5_ARTGP|nr:hypothetical protein MGYG_03729 [Nannizzia gypsea CBS 118893]EFR00724.1 hypothetical protein MGYG_03729 [Nannizzia gypsea CBS 118893]
MVYIQGPPMNGFEIPMDMAAGGPFAPDQFGFTYMDAASQHNFFNFDRITAQSLENAGNQGTAAFVDATAVPAFSATPAAPIFSPTTPATPVTAVNLASQAAPITVNVGEAKQPRQPCRAGTDDPENYTDAVPSQSSWSFDNLPDILYVFRGPDRPRGNINVPLKPSPWPEHPPMRAFDLLPDRISSNVEEFRVEAWMRLDRRIQLRDITDRMNPKYRIFTNTLQQRGVRFRQAFSIASWGVSSKQTDTVIEIIRSKLIENGIDPNHNTTRGLTPGVYVDQNGITQRIPTPKQYSKRPDTTIRRGMAAQTLILAPTLAQATQALTPNTTPEKKTATSKFILVTPSSVASPLPATATPPPPPAIPNAAASAAGGLPTPDRSPSNTMRAQVPARATDDAISDPQAACVVTPIPSASGKAIGVRAPDMETVNAILAGTMESVRQVCQDDLDFVDKLNLETTIMQDHMKRLEEQRRQSSDEERYFQEIETYYERFTPASSPARSYSTAKWPIHLRTRTSTRASEPLTISNPKTTLRKVLNRNCKGSASPRIQKNPIWKDPRCPSTRIHQQLQSLCDSTSNADASDIAHTINGYRTPTAAQTGQQITGTQISNESLEDEDIELIDTSDDEDFGDSQSESGHQQENLDYYILAKLNGVIVRDIVENNPNVKTEDHFLGLCREYIKSNVNFQMEDMKNSNLPRLSADSKSAFIATDDLMEDIERTPTLAELVNIYEHPSQPEHPNFLATSTLREDNLNGDAHERLTRDTQDIISRPLHELYGMTEVEFVEKMKKYGIFGPVDCEH